MSRSNREELLRAAWSVIAVRGVHGLRVEDVAEAVGVTKSLAYYHFKSRAGLLAATLDYNEGLAPTTILRTADGDGLNRIREAALTEFSNSEPVRMNNIVWHEINAAATFDDELRDRVNSMTRRWVGEVAEAIAEGQRDGSIRADVDAETAAEALTALIAGFIERVLIDESCRDRARNVVSEWITERLRPVAKQRTRAH
ncbi:TetR/AcrR family transcriptional regulator [Mycolicibacterium sp. CBM1]